MCPSLKIHSAIILQLKFEVPTSIDQRVTKLFSSTKDTGTFERYEQSLN